MGRQTEAARDGPARVVEKVRGAIAEHRLLGPGEALVLGFSGGPDSLCLAAVLMELGYRPHLAHLDHGLRGEEGQEDARFAAAMAGRWGLDHSLAAADVPSLAAREGLSLEEAARRARYRFLGQVSRRLGVDKVAVAHQADDQVETIVMHFLRGAALAGLRGMRHRSRRGGLWILRPLLDVTRQEVLAYLRAAGLEPRFDRTNLELSYFRNRLRHELLPRLKSYNPRFPEALLRAARSLQEDHRFLQGQVKRSWLRLVHREAGSFVVRREGFLRLPAALQSHLLRRLVFRSGARLRDFGYPATRQALQLIAGPPAEMPLPGRLRLWVGYEEFVVGRVRPEPGWPSLEAPVRLPVPGEVSLPGGWVARARWRPAAEASFQRRPPVWEAWLDPDAARGELWLRTYRPGDRFQPLGMEGHKSLREFFVDERIPRSWRRRLPLLVRDGEILWVAGFRLSQGARLRGAGGQALHVVLAPSGDMETRR